MSDFSYKMTVIMPSYNNGRYIRQAIDSILAQKVNFSYQIIITDDASTDDSVQIIKEYEKNYPDKILALYSNENQRLFRNYLKAVDKMSSEYFCLLDPDDYWTDEDRLQKAVDFLDSNPEYTIYATNLHKLYNDGTMELKYEYSGMVSCTSTYEDYLNQRAVLSCTPSSTYRNVYFSQGIPKEFRELQGTIFEETFRADAARNLIHLKMGKAYFLNESIGVCRVQGKGLNSGLSEAEKCIEGAYDHIGFYEFFGKENLNEYTLIIKQRYISYVKEYYKELLDNGRVELKKSHAEWLAYVKQWLKEYWTQNEYTRIPFSLELFSSLKYNQLIIWGTGSAAEKLLKKYNIEIKENTLFADNNAGRHGQEFMGRKIIAPEDIKNYKNAVILPASSYYKEIIQQILENELCDKSRILNLYDYEVNFA